MFNIRRKRQSLGSSIKGPLLSKSEEMDNSIELIVSEINEFLKSEDQISFEKKISDLKRRVGGAYINASLGRLWFSLDPDKYNRLVSALNK